MTDRRSDLDALRGAAMILGIVLHTCASFFGFPWSVHEQQSNTILALLCVWIHGFRMPLFFMLSGFFTQLVYEQRGLKKLMQQRFERIAIPLVLASLCILPLNNFVLQRATASRHREPVIEAIVRGDIDFLKSWLLSGGDPNHEDGIFFRRLVSWASLSDNAAALRLLRENQADINAQDSTGNTPLHLAIYFGSADAFEFLITHGADPSILSKSRHYPLEGISASAFLASDISELIGLTEKRSVNEVQRGRAHIRDFLTQHPEASPQNLTTGPQNIIDTVVSLYWSARSSDRFVVHIGNTPFHLLDSELFDHLWFLNFLLWILLVYAALIATKWKPAPKHLGYAAICTLAGQFFMGTFGAGFGPDTELGLLPGPHLLMYYAGFFFLGVIMKGSEPIQKWIEKHWRWILLVSLFILFPAALATRYHRLIALILQPLFACGMSLGTIGLFHHYVKTPSKKLRWLADSSYWLYLAHVPIVMMAQLLVTTWSISSWAKFLFVLGISHFILLVSYQWLIRYSWVGRLLHGPKQASTQASTISTVKPS